MKYENTNSDDGLFTLETVACLGACGLAPVMTVDGEVHAKMDPERAIELLETIRKAAKNLEDARVFDVYRGGQVPAGKKSMAFTLTFTPAADAEKAFTPETLDGFVKKILADLKFRLGIELR